jgi:acyl carrier protein
MVTIDEVAGLVARQLRGELPDGTTLDEDAVISDLGLSSLQLTDLVFTLEEESGCEFDGRVAEVITLGDLTALANGSRPARADQP